MSWLPNFIPPHLTHKIYKYLLQRYMGWCFKGEIGQDQFSVELLNGTTSLHDIHLDVQALNEWSEQQNWPVEFVEGYIDGVSVAVSWGSLLTKSSTVEVTGLRVVMQPKQRIESATSVFESMWSSMTSSMHLAEDYAKEEFQTDSLPAYEGPQIFADIIDSILNRVTVTFTDANFLLEYLPKGSLRGVGLIIHVDRFTYTDESSSDPSKEEATGMSQEDAKKAYFEQSYTSRSTRVEGVSMSTVEFSSKARTISLPDEPESKVEGSDEKNQPKRETSKALFRSSNERTVIPAAQFGGKIEVVVRLKRTIEIEGPKVSVEKTAGSFLVFLSPRQLRLLLELATGLSSPDTDCSNLAEAKYAGKPMSSLDYERIEKDLQQLSNEAPNLHGFGEGHGWATGALDSNDVGDKFLPVERNISGSSGLYESALSGISTMESSFSSSILTSGTDVCSRTHKRMDRLDRDPTAENSRFEIHLASVYVILLHEDLLSLSLDKENSLLASGVTQMQNLSNDFFAKSFDIFAANSFTQANTALDKACQRNHLRLLAAPLHLEADEKTTDTAFSIRGSLDTTYFELTECLYPESRDSVQHVPLITFADQKPEQSEGPAAAKSNLKLLFKHLERFNKQSKTRPKTELTFSLDQCLVEFDISLMDRISALLFPQPICVVPKANNPWPQYEFMSESDSKMDLKVTSPSMTVKLRFPIPDFRKDISRTPWWDRHVRPDYVTLVLSGMSFQTVLQSNQASQEYAVKCKIVNTFYHDDSNSNPAPIGKAHCENRPMGAHRDVPSECKLSVKIFPIKTANSEEASFSDAQPASTSISAGLLENLQPNGPFSSKRVVYESDTPHNKMQTDDSKELLVPGDKAEIREFIEITTASARIRIDVSFPVLVMQLLSKHQFETMYNRINNDLLLWQSSAPRPQPATPAYNDRSYGNVDNDCHEHFSLCKTGIFHGSDSSSDEESEDNVYYSTWGSRLRVPQNQAANKNKSTQSDLTLNLRIGRGLLCICTPARDATTSNIIPNQHGEFHVNVENATIFMVNGYMGDMTLGFTCLEFHTANLFHCEMNSTPSHSPPMKDIGTKPSSNLHPTIYASESGMLATNKNRAGDREMVTVCVKLHQTDEHKNVSIAAGFNKVTLRHRMCHAPNSWLTQLMDFFNVNDYPVPGYNVKEILTELFLHFWDSSIDYRPFYLPLRAAVTLGTFSISSHLNTDSSTTTLRFIVEECGIFLSQKGVKRNAPYTGSVNLKRDYVNVKDVGLFEISLVISDKKIVPHFHLRASNNLITIRSCADSAMALAQLIRYLESNGDLMPPEDDTASGSPFSTPRHLPKQELVTVTVEPQESTNLSESQHQQINDLLQDALQEAEASTASRRKRVNPDLFSYNGAKMYYFPDEQRPPQDAEKPLPQVTSELGHVPFQPNLAESDEEFCFIDQEPDYIFPKGDTPEIKWLTNGPIRIIDNHFTVPSEKTDPLKTPKDFPTPVKIYTLCDLSIKWLIYAGNDFESEDDDKKKTVNFAGVKTSDSVSFSKVQGERIVIGNEKVKKMSWQARGGRNRDHNVLMEMRLNKIRLQHEVYPETSSKASRLVLIVSEFEVRDRLKSSQLNKFLYHYISQLRPKQSNAPMLTIKTLFVRPDPQLRRQECCLKISLLPLRFNIDQDALQFLMSFFGKLCSDAKDDEFQVASSKHNTPIHQPPVMTVNEQSEEELEEEAKKVLNQNFNLLLDEDPTEQKPSEEAPPEASSSSEYSPIYFREVIFSHDVPIRLDYQGKHFDLQTHGPLHGILLGLTSLNCSELVLKRVHHRHGLLGIDKVISFLCKEWGNDIKKNQIKNLLIGVGPMYSLTQLIQGIKDLFTMPFEQYRKDGRFLRGLHRGANSFTTSTAMACLELTTRLILLIQLTAETAFDMLTPGPSVRINPRTKVRRKRYKQPKDIREGVTNAYKLMIEGIEETADNILQVASHEHELKGYSGAVGGVIRQIPPTIIKPIVIASEAATNVLGGMRCQLVPDARKEANEKWRNEEDTYDS